LQPHSHPTAQPPQPSAPHPPGSSSPQMADMQTQKPPRPTYPGRMERLIPQLLTLLGPCFVVAGIGMKEVQTFAELSHDAMKAEGVCKAASKIKVMAKFNRMFKLYGVMFPFAVLALRVLALLLSKRKVSLVSELKNVVVIYIVITVGRIGVYMLTLLSPQESMSDHIFLGLSVCALTRMELHAALRGLREWNLAFVLPGLLALALNMFVHTNDMISTQYHTAEESILSVVVGMALFEIPMFFYIGSFR